MYTLLWYPKCSTCQKAKKFLEAKKINFTLRNIVEEVPQIDELKEWILQSKLNINKWFNTSGQLYRTMNLKEKRLNMTMEEQIKLLSTNGMLIKRPILITEQKIYVGFHEKEYQVIK